ncbi:MAG: hypothetical protein P4N59_27785 [Negativicutes bacterium]|nr:hypothetical protein [Negativicutes bacterium]
MLLRLAAADAMILGRGLIVLLVVIALGVAIAEKQLNNLTQRQEHLQTASIRRDAAAGTYGLSLLGNDFRFKAIYPVAGLSNTKDSFTLSVGERRWTIPTVIYADLDEIEYWLQVWRRQFVAEVFKTKEALERYLLLLKPFLLDISRSIRQ